LRLLSPFTGCARGHRRLLRRRLSGLSVAGGEQEWLPVAVDLGDDWGLHGTNGA
jgi:hypothetical protein